MRERAPKGKSAQRMLNHYLSAKSEVIKQKPPTCGQCSHIHKIETALICYRFPPIAVVIDNKPQNMRCAVTADERACGEFKR